MLPLRQDRFFPSPILPVSRPRPHGTESPQSITLEKRYGGRGSGVIRVLFLHLWERVDPGAPYACSLKLLRIQVITDDEDSLLFRRTVAARGGARGPAGERRM